MANDKQWTFDKPHRTRGMAVFNWFGEALRSRGWKDPLTADKLMQRAMKLEQLTDWGDDSFREPLERLVDSFETEARLSPIGRVILRIQTAQLLRNRLRITQAIQQRPEALDTPVPRPVFVLGLPRTGTTLMYNLLAQHPQCRPLMIHETMFPLGARMFGRQSDCRSRTKFVARVSNIVAPGLRAVHPLAAQQPEECTWLLANSLTSPYFMLQAHVPSYMRWLLALEHERFVDVYRYYRQQLQLLQHGDAQPASHWVLKSPAHLMGLDALLDVFPDACVVHTHRDFADVVPSACSLFAVVRGVYSDAVDPKALGPEVVSLLGESRRRAEERSSSSPQVCNVEFDRLVSSPLETVEDIYRHFSLELPDEMTQSMQQWLGSNPRNKHGRHKYTLSQFGLTQSDIDRTFARFSPAREKEVPISV